MYFCTSVDGRVSLFDKADIAIIGMAGRFPRANNFDEYWHSLQQGINLIRFLSEGELEASGESQDLMKNPDYVRVYSSFDSI